MEQQTNREEPGQAYLRDLVSDWRPLGTRWRPTRTQSLWITRIVIVMGLLVVIGYDYGLTLWDWLKLLIVPAVIAAGGVWFSQQQRERELAIAEQRAQDEALQAYLDQMSQLLADEKRPLHRASPGDSLSTVARARTLTVLPGLDKNRKGRLLQFLVEAALIQGDPRKWPVINLDGADLSGATLRGLDLHGANLRGAKLDNANLRGAKLDSATLDRAYLRGAHLGRAYLFGASLRNTYLIGADLSDAILDRANLREARLRDATLHNASLRDATLHDARFSNANLDKAKLIGANLSKADLRGARQVTDEILEQQASSLKGTIMPGGWKHV